MEAHTPASGIAHRPVGGAIRIPLCDSRRGPGGRVYCRRGGNREAKNPVTGVAGRGKGITPGGIGGHSRG